MIGTAAAIYELHPTARFRLHHENEPDEYIEWLDEVIEEPTAEALETALASVQQRMRAKIVKQECSTLILERVDEKDQRNLAARSVLSLTSLRAGDLSAETVAELEAELSVMSGISNWIQAMKEECRRAIADGDDPEWPAWDEDWNDLVDLV